MVKFNEFFTVECPHCGVACGVSKSAYLLNKVNWMCHCCNKPFTVYTDKDTKKILVKKYEKTNK